MTTAEEWHEENRVRVGDDLEEYGIIAFRAGGKEASSKLNKSLLQVIAAAEGFIATSSIMDKRKLEQTIKLVKINL
ncbi:hypothetical protein KAR91_46695 [Candidatus Pacearchaeota archaeon]|nr:hypothetical protein [Candidatus Pacearchaeota archaeon]